MIRLNRWEAYGLGIVLAGLIYLIAQGIFFAGTSKANGSICMIKRGAARYYYENFYVCFTASDKKTYRVKAGSNMQFDQDTPVKVIYKTNNPSIARIADTRALWVIPSFPYIIVWGIIMALLTGAFYGSRYMFISWKPFRLWMDN